jgi:hypothetical protein
MVRIGALLCALAIAAGCGGGGVTDTQSARADCIRQTVGKLRANEMLDAQLALARLCAGAVASGYADDGEITGDELESLFRQDPGALAPVCDAAAKAGFARVPASAQSEIGMSASEWGVRYCRALIRGDYFTEDGSLSPASWTRLLHDHPDLFAPFLAAGLIEECDPSLGISRATCEKIVREAAEEAFRRGLVTASSASEYNVDQARFQALLREVATKYAGE